MAMPQCLDQVDQWVSAACQPQPRFVPTPTSPFKGLLLHLSAMKISDWDRNGNQKHTVQRCLCFSGQLNQFTLSTMIETELQYEDDLAFNAHSTGPERDACILLVCCGSLPRFGGHAAEENSDSTPEPRYDTCLTKEVRHQSRYTSS